jgi:hypothetical protein
VADVRHRELLHESRHARGDVVVAHLLLSSKLV